MKIAIVSDTHNNITNFNKAINWIKKEGIHLILHCGDINSRGTMDEAIELFSKPERGALREIKFVRGNADTDLPDLPDIMELEINGKRIAFTHFPVQAKKLAQSGNYDLVFYGHTHRPWDEKIGSCHMINPGELAGQFYKATFAVYDTAADILELKILEKI